MSKESLKELRERLLRDELAQELIRMRAFEIYTLRGGQPGGEAHDWFQAEGEVLTFLIEEESRRASGSQWATAATAPEDRTSKPTNAEPRKPAKRTAPGSGSARKTTAESAEKKPAKRASKKPADSATKLRGHKKA